MKLEQVTYLFVSAFVDELARSGLRHVVICPGSRSTPLATTFARRAAETKDVRLWMHVDERSAAYFALGMAKSGGQPVAVLSTSGTAAANFLPAVVEARYARVPLIVLTADRPPELRDIGAPQTIDQIKLYGSHVKWAVDMPTPDATPELLRYARAMANRAAAESFGSPAGPVHLNFPFREPLLTLPIDEAIVPARAAGRAYTEFLPGTRVLVGHDFNEVARLLVSRERGLIVCGNEYRHDANFAVEVTKLAEALRWPILADPLSGVRCGGHPREDVIDAYDAFLRDRDFVEQVRPQVIVRFGALPTSKPLLQYMQRHANIPQVVVDGGAAWNDAALRASLMVRADSMLFCGSLNNALERLRKPESDGQWIMLWRSANTVARRIIVEQVLGFDEIFEGRVFSELADLLPDGATLYASSSMPVRDLDTFTPTVSRSIRFLSNRGANGIDGVVSSALGASAASGGPLVLVIGDLALYHDMNGLLAAKLHKLNATIVLINNDGGGIFSFLPQADQPEHFELLFGTPTGLKFRPVAELYGARYIYAENWEQFRSAVESSLRKNGLNLIEVRTNRAHNVTMHRQIWAAVTAALKEILEDNR